MNKRFLITGGCGFIGSNLAINLKNNFPDSEVIALDNFYRDGSKLNIERLKKENIEVIEGDIRDREFLFSLSKIDCLIDAAAEPSVMAGRDDSTLSVTDINLVGTINCLELARRNNSNFIFLSTNRVYPIKELNELEEEAVSEDFPLSNGSRTLYGATKLAAEYIIQEYIKNFNIKGVINRCGVIAGPWQFGKSDQGIVSYWLSHYFYKKPLSYIGFGGEGSQVRDLLHVNDLCKALINQIENIDKYNGEIFNIGGGKKNTVSLAQMSAICEEVTGNSLEIKSIKETRPGDIKYYTTDYSKFNNVSGWKPEKNIKEIFQDTFEWMKNNSSELESILT